jgi:fructose-bisphosphate aldolase class 1
MTTYFNRYPKELQEELKRIANAITAPGKGILAADESTATCGKRFAVSFQQSHEISSSPKILLIFSIIFQGHQLGKQ